MKKNLLKTAIATTAVAVSGSALAYDNHTHNGDSPYEEHFFRFLTPSTSSFLCGGVCQGLGGDTEWATGFRITNLNQGPGDHIDNYIGNSGGANVSGADLDNISTQIYYPGAPAYNVYNFNSPPQGPNNQWNIVTDEEGKITSGWNFSEAIFFGTQYHTLFDYDNRVAISIEQCPAPPPIASYFALDYSTATTLANTLAANFDPACVFTEVADLAYITCDTQYECGQFSKSVPVPAFAAGALGLGLLGITYLTSRRRSIK